MAAPRTRPRARAAALALLALALALAAGRPAEAHPGGHKGGKKKKGA